MRKAGYTMTITNTKTPCEHNLKLMARKEINVFGTSFLDLLSGALAAVIILFVIVPKLSLIHI